MPPKFYVISPGDFNATTGRHTVRRARTLSKNGCLLCKQRKVKCDEYKPACRKCSRIGRECHYLTGPAEESKIKANPQTQTQLWDMGVSETGSPTSDLSLSSFQRPHRMPDVHFSSHADHYWQDIFPFPGGHEIMQMSLQSRLLQHTVFSMSAAHLRKLTGHTVYQFAESFYLSSALAGYRKALQKHVEGDGLADFTTLILVATLLNICAFAAHKPGVGREDCWVYSSSSDRLDWLCLQAGLRPLVRSAQSSMQSIIQQLGSIFLSRQSPADILHKLTRDERRVPPHWVQWYGVDETGDGGWNNVYRSAVVALANLRHIEPSQGNSGSLLIFLTKLDQELLDLVYNRDVSAMWLVGYWLGLMTRFPALWWSEQRARLGYLAICEYLENLNIFTENDLMAPVWKLLLDDLLAIGQL